MARHLSLRDHLVARAEQGHTPEFQPSNDEPLVRFAALFAGTSWYSLDVNKHQPSDAWGEVFELTAEVRTGPEAEPTGLLRHWAPGFDGPDPAQGFRQGVDSSFWGSAPPEASPPDPIQAAFLLLVGSNYVHLSASREQTPPLVRGAISESGAEFRYVVLAR